MNSLEQLGREFEGECRRLDGVWEGVQGTWRDEVGRQFARDYCEFHAEALEKYRVALLDIIEEVSAMQRALE